MNKRILKKTAKFWLAGKITRAAGPVARSGFWDNGASDGPRWAIECYPLRLRLYKEIYNQALRQGWDGYWRNSPFISYD